MEKITYKEVKSILNTHNFYCDMCGKYLGSTKEHDDGYYSTIGDYDLKFNVNSERYKLHCNLCVECGAKKKQEIINGLLSMGFVKTI